MKKFREYISEEVVPSALVANGTIDIDNEDVRASINLALAKVTSDGAITPYIALNRISKALSYFHIILPKRIYLEGGKGVEVHELRQFGHKMGMTDQGEFVHEVPGKYYLFLQYGMNNAMPYGGQLAYPNMGGTFRVMAKVVDKIELDRLVSMAELALAEECDAEMQQRKARDFAPRDAMHDVTSDEKKKGNKAAVADSEKGLKESKKVKVKLNPEKEVGYTVHDVGPGGKKTLSQSGKTKVKDIKEAASRNPTGAMAIRRSAKAMASRDSDEIAKKYPNAHRPKSDKWAEEMKARRIAADDESRKRYDKKHGKKEDVKEDKDPCWKGYEMVGMKNKRGRKVPNCVPVKEGILDKLNPFSGVGSAIDKAMGTGSAKAAPDTRIMGNPDTQKKPQPTSQSSSQPVVKEGQIDENLGKGMKKYKFWYGDPRGMKDRLKKAGPEFTKKIANSTEKQGGAAELQRRIAKKIKEETQIDELSYDTVARYHRKAAERFHTGEEPEGKRKKGREMATRKRAGGMMGIPKAKVMAKEETQIDEISQQLTGRYRSLAGTDLAHRTSKALRDYQADKPVDKENRRKSLNRVAGIRRADKRFKEETISEKAPPGAKFERMVKHIKAGYSKDGLTKKEKGIAYATAWKAKKRESED